MSMSTQMNDISIEDNAFFIYTPDPLVFFDDARYRQKQLLKLTSLASVIFVDWYTSGRIGRDKMWGVQTVQNETHVEVDGCLLLTENLRLENSVFSSIRQKVGNKHIFGYVLLIGPKTEYLRSRASILMERRRFVDYQQMLRQDQSSKSTLLVSVSHFQPHIGTMIRFSGDSVEECYEFLFELLKPVSNEVDKLYPYRSRLHASETVFRSDNYSSYCGIEDHPVSALRRFDTERKMSLFPQETLN